MGDKTGSKNSNWKGGRTVASNGYVLVKVGHDHHLADVRGYAYEHRLVAEQILGRRLEPGEQVHHRNADKADNDPTNIEVFASRAVHAVEHRAPTSTLRHPCAPNPVVLCACGCGAAFTKYDRQNRPRRFRSGHNTDRDHEGRFMACAT